MTASAFSTYIGVAIPVISFLALAVGVIYYILGAGNMKALHDSVSTWRELAEGYEATIDKLKADQESCKAEIDKLRRELQTQTNAMDVALDTLIEAFTRNGICTRDDCPFIKAGGTD